MAWFMDTYSQQVGHPVPEIVTGKPLVLGGTEGREIATGLGVVYCIEELMRDGGRAARPAARGGPGARQRRRTVVRELAQRGATIVGVSDVTGGIVNPGGLDVADLKDWLDQHRFLRDFPARHRGRAAGRSSSSRATS